MKDRLRKGQEMGEQEGLRMEKKAGQQLAVGIRAHSPLTILFCDKVSFCSFIFINFYFI